MEPEELARLELPPEPASIHTSRSFVAATLHGRVDEDVLDAALVVTSELATNAMLHAQTGFEVVVRFDGSCLRLEVHDGNPRLPHRKSYSSTSGTGRGLVLVESLATVAGAEQTDRGKVVWAVLTEDPLAPPVVASVDDEREAPSPVPLIPEPERAGVLLDDVAVAAVDDDPELRARVGHRSGRRELVRVR